MTFKFILGKSKYTPVRYDISIARKVRLKGLTNFSINTNWIDPALLNELQSKKNKESTIIFKEKKDIQKGEKTKFKDVRGKMEDFEDFIEEELDELKKQNLLSIKDSLKDKIDEYLGKTKKQKKKKNLTLLQFIDFYAEYQKGIDTKKGFTKQRASDNAIKEYKLAKKILEQFKEYSGEPISYENIDLEFINDYQGFLFEEKNYAVNTVGKMVKHINTFMNKSREHKYNTNLEYHKGFKVLKEGREWDYLNEKELAKLEKSKLNEIESSYRDYFLLMSYTGMRVGDMLRLTRSNINKDKKMIFFLESKNNIKRYFTITDNVQTILDRWNGTFPKDIINKNITDTYINKFLKKTIKDKTIRCHSGRRNFCTNEYLKGSPVEKIMRQSGHKDYKTFKDYIVASGEDILEAFDKNNDL